MSISQAFKEYEDAVDEVEVAVDRNPREAPTFIRAADEARRAWEDAREDLNTFKMDMRTNIPQPGPEIVEKESRSNLRTWGVEYINEYRTQSRKLDRKLLEVGQKGQKGSQSPSRPRRRIQPRIEILQAGQGADARQKCGDTDILHEPGRG